MKNLFTFVLLLMLAMFIAVPMVSAGDCVYDADFYMSLKGVSAKTELNGVNFATIPNGLVSTYDDDATESYISPGFALGLKYGKYFRTELEYINRGDMDYSSDGIDLLNQYIPGGIHIPGGFFNITADIDTKTVFVNQYVDSKDWNGLGFYGGIGVGLAMHKTKTDFNIIGTSILNEKGSNTSLAYSVTAGIYYNITSTLTADLGYRYLNLGEVDMGTLIEANEMEVREIVCSVRYLF